MEVRHSSLYIYFLGNMHLDKTYASDITAQNITVKKFLEVVYQFDGSSLQGSDSLVKSI